MLLFCLYLNCCSKVSHIKNVHHVTLNKNTIYYNNIWHFLLIYYDSHELLHTQMKSWVFWRCLILWILLSSYNVRSLAAIDQNMTTKTLFIFQGEFTFFSWLFCRMINIILESILWMNIFFHKILEHSNHKRKIVYMKISNSNNWLLVVYLNYILILILVI